MRVRSIIAAILCAAAGGCRDSAPTLQPAPGLPAPPIVSAAPGNTAPGAMFAMSPRYPQPGDTVTVDGSYSHDPDGQVVRYRWDFGNGVSEVTGALAKTVYRTAGTYSLSLTTVDNSGDSSTVTLSLPVSTAAPPVTAVDSAQSTLTLSAASTGAGTGVTATVTARNASGTALSAVPVAVSALGRNLTISPATGTTNGSGVSTATVASTFAQSATVRAVANYTALATTRALTVVQSAVSATRSSIRLTQSTLTALTDSAIVEVTARDTAGNVASNVSVALASSATGVTLPASGLTDANGRWTGTVKVTALCAGATSTLSATVGGVAITPTVTLTGNAAAAYTVCGAALWLDASDATTTTLDGSNRVSQWRDKSGNARHAANATTAEQPTAVANVLNGLRVVRYTSANLLRSPNALQGITNAAEVFAVASATASQNTASFLFHSDSQLTQHSTERFSAHLPWTDGAVYWDFGTCCTAPGRTSIAYAAAGAALPAALWSVGTMTGATTERHIRRNGSPLVSATGTDTIAFADRTLRIGSTWGGDLAEFIVMPRVLSAAERTAIEHGLMAKWSLGTLTLTAGNSQSSAAGYTPPTALQVRVTDAAGSGVPNATVLFTVTSGGGRVNGALSGTGTTDASGYATAPSWIPDVGSNQVTASYGGQSVVFSGTGTLPTGVSLRLDFSDSSNVFTGSGCTGAVSNGSSIGCVKDRSGNAYNALQATAGARPTFSTSALNGRSTLAFNYASDQYLIINAAAMRSLRSTSRSIFAVARSTATTDNSTNSSGAIVNWIGYNTGLHFNGYPVPTWVQDDEWENPTTGGVGTFTGTWLNASSAIVISSTFAVTASTMDTNIWRDGANQGASGVTSAVVTGAADLYIGIAAPGTGGYNWRLNGQIAEILIYPRVVTTTERQQIEHYLGWRWGISVP